MKILHTVEFYHPSIGGTQEVVKQISERLVKSGHDVTIATTRLPERNARDLNGVRIEEFDVSGNAVRGLSGETKLRTLSRRIELRCRDELRRAAMGD
jgi:hypothetical protein